MDRFLPEVEGVYSSRTLRSIQAVFWLRPPLRGLTFAALTLGNV